MKQIYNWSLGLTVLLLLVAVGCKTSYSDIFKKDKLVFSDNCTNNWLTNWTLDGTRSTVINSEDGMELIAGPEHGNDTCHAVLWTKKSFDGNICIEYEFTRTDTTTRCVNILYFLAEGRGDEAYPKNISKWECKRTVPHMYTYFNNMHTYHISYAAFAAKEFSGENDYIRLRRYNPLKVGLGNTDVPGDYFKTGLFKTDISYKIQVLKLNNFVEMSIENMDDASDRKTCKWNVSQFADCASGRIGIRHMYTRSARYKNFKVWQISER